MIFHQINHKASTKDVINTTSHTPGTNPRFRYKIESKRLTRVFRGDGDDEDVDGYWPPQDYRVVGDDDGIDFPL